VKPSFKEVHEYNQLEAAIPALELEIGRKTELLNSGISDHEQLGKLANEIAALNAELESKTMRWLELAEKLDV
jgi:ATP-binding cassette subfamily F protein uup